jgi:hypothetical protein
MHSILFLHLIITLIRLARPGAVRSVVTESVNRSRKRAPDLRTLDGISAGLCAALMRPARVVRSAIVVQPSAIFDSTARFSENIACCSRPNREADRDEGTAEKLVADSINAHCRVVGAIRQPQANDDRVRLESEAPGDLPGSRVTRGRDPAEVHRRDVPVGITVVHVVERVEGVAAELEADALIDSKSLAD